MSPDSALATRFVPSPNFGDRRGRAIDRLVLHYTGMATGEAAFDRLRDPAAEVSCHYLVWEDGRIDQLVAERDRAWHAGRGAWAGESDINSVSIGIEIVNAGHDGGCPPYPDAQVAATVALVGDIVDRHAIRANRILAHSDIAPDRKADPGEWFPWHRLAICHVDPAPLVVGPSLRRGDGGDGVSALQGALADLGYDLPVDGIYGPRTEAVVTAFQRRWRPQQVDGDADVCTMRTLERVAGRFA